MARSKGKKEVSGADKESISAADYYDLKKDAVRDLISADEGEVPQYSEEELNKYRRKKGRIRISDPVKVILIKFWFAGMICFFFIWGLGGYLVTMIDTIAIVGIGYGIVTDLLTNNVIRFFAETEGKYDKWMMFPSKKYISFVLNILYAFPVIFVVYTIYNVINLTAMRITGNEDRLFLGVEPILFGVFCTGADLLFVGMKNLFIRIVNDAKRSV